jgi:hypothetical protein
VGVGIVGVGGDIGFGCGEELGGGWRADLEHPDHLPQLIPVASWSG